MNAPTRLLIALLATCLVGPAAAESNYNATANRNGLAGKYPVRGFGDSTKVDVWVPFTVMTRGSGSATRATLTMVVKPISQLIGTDSLILRGASGKSYTVYKKFSGLARGRWSTVTVDLSKHPDVMAAVRAGRLDGVIQDDTAVRGVYLDTRNHTARRPDVHIFDVYYWGFNPSTQVNSWYRYQSYWAAADATRAIKDLASKGYRTSWKKRFWRAGR